MSSFSKEYLNKKDCTFENGYCGKGSCITKTSFVNKNIGCQCGSDLFGLQCYYTRSQLLQPIQYIQRFIFSSLSNKISAKQITYLREFATLLSAYDSNFYINEPLANAYTELINKMTSNLSSFIDKSTKPDLQLLEYVSFSTQVML